MTQITAKDILQDIEFEIAQGLVSKEGVGPAIQAVRQFQNKARIETFEVIKANDPSREALGRQFQLADMLLNLLQEMDIQQKALQYEIESIRKMKPESLAPSPAGREPALPEGSDDHAQQSLSSAPLNSAIQTIQNYPLNLDLPQTEMEIRSREEVETAMSLEAIDVGLQVRPINLPIIGWLLTKLRILYQRPALFYTTLFAHRQAPINRLYGDRILYLESLIQLQQQQIQALNAHLNERPDQAATRSESASEGEQV